MGFQRDYRAEVKTRTAWQLNLQVLLNAALPLVFLYRIVGSVSTGYKTER